MTIATASSFKPPQHKHAHHLHSIPPRQKSTRTMILDQLLCFHSRARFAQVNAELPPAHDPERERDVTAAKNFKARADGLERVLTAMLHQPPPEEDELPWDSADPPVAPNPFLPNGLRFRIVLSRLLNDLFATHEVDDDGKDAPTTYLSAPPAFASYSVGLPALSRISSFAQHHAQAPLPKLPSFHTLTAAASGAGSDAPPPAHSLLPPAGSIFSTIPRGAGPESAWALGRYTPNASDVPQAPSPHYPSSSSSSTMPPPPPPRVYRAIGRSKELYNAGVNVQHAQPSTSAPARVHVLKRCPHHLSYTCRVSSLCAHSAAAERRVRSSVGSGLARAGSPLRRGAAKETGAGAGGPSMTELLPRFLKLSALIALELGKEWADGAETAARPTTRWYTLFADLLTRAALQGYLYKGWRGTDPVEILLGVGVAKVVPEEDELMAVLDGRTEDGKRFLPDRWPGLVAAWSVLFGSPLDGDPFADFERIMADRRSEFFNVPHHDLGAYLDYMSRVKCPQERVDRQALRFFEAIANWRGEPELEALKHGAAATANSKGKSTVPVAGLTTVSPDSDELPAPTASANVADYFALPPPSPAASASPVSPTTARRPRADSTSSSDSSGSGHDAAAGNKRKATLEAVGAEGAGASKKPATAGAPSWGSGRAWMEEDEYVGPYGI